MKVIRYVDVWSGAQPDDLYLVVPKHLSTLAAESKRYRVEFEIPDPVVDRVIQASATEDRGDPNGACQEITAGEPTTVHLYDNTPR